MGQRIFTGQAHPSDYLLFLYLLNIKVKEPAPPIKEQNSGGDKDGNNTSKEEGNKTPEEEGANGSKGQGETTTNPMKAGKQILMKVVSLVIRLVPIEIAMED
ncbi:hypothetical protein AAEU33_21560 [Chryseobacterium sp. Chry.R1]|uniref:hypothetical protein n=1 Tax=Chryseobacterium sp. Chry.R1 TaxID=3139392 RepID=UPI0031F94B24